MIDVLSSLWLSRSSDEEILYPLPFLGAAALLSPPGDGGAAAAPTGDLMVEVCGSQPRGRPLCE